MKTEQLTASGDTAPAISEGRHDIDRAFCIVCGALREICCATRVCTLADGRLQYLQAKCVNCCHGRRDV